MRFFLQPAVWLALSFHLLSAAGGHSDVTKLVACRKPLGESLRPFLSYEEFFSKEQTVFFVELTKGGDVVLLKTEYFWDSEHLGIPQAITRQGDPRFPIAFWGAKLAEKLQCKITLVKNTQNVKIKFPGSKKFQDIILKINKRLKAAGFSPIAYLAVASSFLESNSILDLALQASGDFSLFFPYVDNDHRLTPHEVSFHLGSIILPNKFFERARAINLYTREFTRYLKSRKRTLGPIVKRIAEQLEIERAAELDLGTGGLVATLGSARLFCGSGQSYSQILPKLGSKDKEKIMNHIDNLARPSLLPIEALFARLQAMTGVTLKHITRPGLQLEYVYTLPRYGISKRVPLNREEKRKLEGIAADFMKTPEYLAIARGSYEISSPEQWTQELGPYLDQRIEQILSVLQ